MKKTLIIFAILVLGCTEKNAGYPDGTAQKGNLSYQGGSLADWQTKTHSQLVDMLGTNRFVLSQNAPSLARGQTHTTTLTRKALALLKQRADICFQKNTNFIELNDCRSQESAVRLFLISYRALDGKEIGAYLLVPTGRWSRVFDEKSAVPSVVFLHDHTSTKEDAIFNDKGTLKGAALILAQQGFVVLVPDLRGFGSGQGMTVHEKMAREFSKKGVSFMGVLSLDAVVAQNVLDRLDLPAFGIDRPLDRKRNAITGVSLGAVVALFAGALDPRVDLVSVQAHFLGFEVLFSKHHCFCQHVPAMQDKLNIFDVAMLIPPRKLHVAMGTKDVSYNGFASTAFETLEAQAKLAGLTVCRFPFHDQEKCSVFIEIDEGKSREMLNDNLMSFFEGP